MELTFFPQGFNAKPTKALGTDGTMVDAWEIVFVEATGTVGKVILPPEGWRQFQQLIADPEAEAERQKARAKILAPPEVIPPVAGPRH